MQETPKLREGSTAALRRSAETGTGLAEKPGRRSVLTFLGGVAAPLIFAVATGLLLLVPGNVALLLSTALYIVVLVEESRHRIYAVQSIVLGGYFFGCLVASMVFSEQAGLQRYLVDGALIALFALSLLTLMLDFPLHGTHAKGWEPGPVRRTKAFVWLIVCPLAVILPVVCVSHSGAIAVQFGLVMVGAVSSTVIDLLYCGSLYRRARVFTLERFTFREIDGDDGPAVEQFVSRYADEIADAVARDRRAHKAFGKCEIFEEALRKERAATAQVIYFSAYDGDKVVGGVSVALDRAHSRLPLEEMTGLTLGPVRRFGRVMEVRRLSVDGNYRFQQEVIRGLFRCVIEVALEKDMDFMVDLAFHFAAPLLEKAGFERIQAGQRELFEFGSPLRFVILNLAAREFAAHQLIGKQRITRYTVNQSLRYRYYRRALLRHVLRPASERAWLITGSRIQYLLFGGEQE